MKKYNAHSQKFWQKKIKTLTKQIEELKDQRDLILTKYYKMISKDVLDILKNKIKQENTND